MEPAAQPLVGFRAWKIAERDKHTLLPCWQSQAPNTWPATTPAHAQCLSQWHTGMMYANKPKTPTEPKHPDSPPPVATCTCGLYAYYHPDPLVNSARVSTGLWGAIVAWGNIIECERGFKAQHAKPIAFLEQDTLPDITPVAAHYELPILPLDELEQYGHMFGELRPTP